MGRAVIVGGARTPFGKLGGHLRSVSAVELGGIAIKDALKRANVLPIEVGEVILGSVLQGGQGQIPSRQAAQIAEIPWQVKTETINKVCASGMRAVTLGEQLIRLGDEDVIVAGGMESMSQTPYFIEGARFGLRMGDATFKDLMIHDGLTCSFTNVHMGVYGNEVAAEMGISRQEQDEWAYRSHQRAIAAIQAGKFSEEIVPLKINERKGAPTIVKNDESPRKNTTVAKLANLKPVFNQGGTITAGNAPGVNDGAAALVLMSESRALREEKQIMATIVSHVALATEAKDFPKTPGLAINKLLEKTGKTVADIDLFEINEAFAAVALTTKEISNINPDKINVNGGAVALGHPIGASGARIILTLIYELKRRGGGTGIAAICSGGGQGDAIMITVPKES